MSSAQPEAIDLAPKTKPKRKGKGKKTKSKKSKPVVNLGYKDEPVDDQEHADAFTSKLGGKPDWLNPTPPKFDRTAKCGSCQGDQTFLLQLYAPLNDSPYDRTLYLFICPKPTCSGSPDSINILRAMNYNESYANQLKSTKNKEKPPVKSAPQPAPKLENLGSVWGSSSGFGLPVQEPLKDPLVASMEKLTLKDVPKPRNENASGISTHDDVADGLANLTQDPNSPLWPKTSTSLPSYYIATEVEEFYHEDSDNEQEDSLSSDLTKCLEHEAGAEANPTEEASWAGEVYEKSTKPKGVDKAFLAFSARAAHSPGHFLRYDIHGTPLLYSLSDSVADQLLGFPDASSKRSKIPITTKHLPVCEGCGGPRVFEFQVMPTLLSELPFDSLTDQPSRPDNPTSIQEARSLFLACTGWEFGTILVFTCENNCVVGATPGFDGGYYRELALMQVENLL